MREDLPTKQKALADLTDDDIVRACEQNYLDYWRCIGESENARFSESGGVTSCITGISQEIFNVVLKCSIDSSRFESAIDEAIQYLRSCRVPLIWHTGLLSEPRNVGEYLGALGYPHDYDLAAMAIDVSSMQDRAANSPGTSVKIVREEEERSAWASVLAGSWESPRELPAWILRNKCFDPAEGARQTGSFGRTMYLGLLQGEPASACMLFYTDTLAGLQTVGTVRSAQRKGVGSTVIREALRDANALGFSFVVVLSTVEGMRLYEKIGFRQFGKLPEHSMHFEISGPEAKHLPASQSPAHRNGPFR
jgi:ribosomal protein S18 acetylase RimI-like enzyme